MSLTVTATVTDDQPSATPSTTVVASNSASAVGSGPVAAKTSLCSDFILCDELAIREVSSGEEEDTQSEQKDGVDRHALDARHVLRVRLSTWWNSTVPITKGSLLAARIFYCYLSSFCLLCSSLGSQLLLARCGCDAIADVVSAGSVRLFSALVT